MLFISAKHFFLNRRRSQCPSFIMFPDVVVAFPFLSFCAEVSPLLYYLFSQKILALLMENTGERKCLPILSLSPLFLYCYWTGKWTFSSSFPWGLCMWFWTNSKDVYRWKAPCLTLWVWADYDNHNTLFPLAMNETISYQHLNYCWCTNFFYGTIQNISSEGRYRCTGVNINSC